MSATGRGAKRQEADFYPTPSYCVARLLQYVQLPPGRWLEPSAGEGAIIRAVKARRTDIVWTAVEMREECRVDLTACADVVSIADFREWRPDGRPFELVLGNPPFTLASRFISHALEVGERVVFLLRIGFLASEKRCSFFRKVGVPDIHIIPDRPSFTGTGSDATDYAWAEFRPGWAGRREGKVSILYPDTGQLSLLEGA